MYTVKNNLPAWVIESGCIKRGVYNVKWTEKFRIKQFKYNKRLFYFWWIGIESISN